MKANRQGGRGLLRPFTVSVLAILAAFPGPAAHAEDPKPGGISRDDLDKALRAGQEKMNVAIVVGTWKNSDLHMSMTFSETGEFEFKRGENKVEKGLYKVAASGDGVLVSVFFSQGKDYFSVTPLSKDRATWQELKSPTAKPDPEKAVVWTRGAASERAESSPPPNARGKELMDLQAPGNLIGNWKSSASDGLVTTMSFSERGEFNYAKEKDGKKDDVVKAAYTAQAASGGLVVTITEGNEKVYYGIAFLSKNRCFKQFLKSPDDRIDSNKPGMILTREP